MYMNVCMYMNVSKYVHTYVSFPLLYDAIVVISRLNEKYA